MDPKRAESDDLGRGRIQAPSVRQPSSAIRFLQAMTWQNRKTIKQALGRSVGARQVKSHCISIQFSDYDRLTVQDQLVALSGMDFFVQHHAKGESNVVGIEGLAV